MLTQLPFKSKKSVQHTLSFKGEQAKQTSVNYYQRKTEQEEERLGINNCYVPGGSLSSCRPVLMIFGKRRFTLQAWVRCYRIF